MQRLETQIHMNAAGSCFHNGGKLQETEPYILCCISFSNSGSTFRKGEAHSGRAEGSKSSRGWENKSRNIRPCCLDILTRLNSNLFFFVPDLFLCCCSPGVSIFRGQECMIRLCFPIHGCTAPRSLSPAAQPFYIS